MSSARDAATIHRAFAVLRTTCDPRGHDLLDELERWMLFDNAMLRISNVAGYADPPADLPDGDNFSRKVPDTPALRLVGAFHCDPDESGGAA